MRGVRRTAAFLLLAAAFCPAAVAPPARPAQRPDDAPLPAARYRLEYEIRGGAISRLLLLFPLRVYYEAAAALDLTAVPAGSGAVAFSFAGLPHAAYVMRTLGFSGKTMALLTLDEESDLQASETFRGELLSQWQARAPEFADRVRKVKKFSHRLLATGPRPFGFTRDAAGLYRDVSVHLEPRYVYYPARTGIYFRVFPTLAGLLKLLNHPFLPAAAEAGREEIGPLPASWEGDSLDFSADLNFLARQIEAAVESLVTVRQKFPFRMRFRVAARDGEAVEILGEARPDVPLWKGFQLREVHRRIRLRPGDRQLLSEEFRMEIRNKKGQGGSGRLQLTLIPPKEDPR
ncbi:MAG TPA: hypothetical protein PK919_04800 [Candidatus Aminicenantes bacterium]|nr:hypothetical protein [Candidatus Aminicenantes bacterium]